ncbi:hypothetical protein [Paenibacillus radicis (ex Gao et al. 2016)]|uniref:Uncharacterized protein n=1 Tax=Paenibacillus radicis (ex Gao et al. 2016) TaxID=1737354 RepID=A0A917HAW4_9BACL|nr:hypothetical protein [Paenibacillus radicis (ex Gao et al. 2016)]GGG72617.1 hypothetical protein GCM10010918_30600 [Paenibacillus radicis (ex Gao et al. 2016)]
MKNEDNNEQLYTCPLLDREIDQAACYDINMVAGGWIKKEVLVCLEKEYGVSIEVWKAVEICPACKHSLI